eukprot:TRINITY_DN28243_c0_g1_i1.p1 TRINITY_DN28243_c0_g1~~TRINITY_DN28243_c0_g1_i1.p1  ORF type:complete len:496 (-),score=46.65 TRINITY_DN28243_c0_g1_i1:99-1586(-)
MPSYGLVLLWFLLPFSCDARVGKESECQDSHGACDQERSEDSVALLQSPRQAVVRMSADFQCNIPDCGCVPYSASWCDASNALMQNCQGSEDVCQNCGGVWCAQTPTSPPTPTPTTSPTPSPPTPPPTRSPPTPSPTPAPPGTYPPASKTNVLDVGEAVRTNFTLVASTTDFGFGAATACGCNGTSATQRLAKHGFIGVATPDWIASPFLTTSGQEANGGSTFADVLNTTYYSNCANGSGGCGKCWHLKTTGEANIYNVTPSKTYSANVIVLDICEDRNAYGNNYQWCIAAKGVPAGGINTNGYSGHCADDSCGFGQYLQLGNFSSTGPGNITAWSDAGCVVDGKWICTNLAGQPLHFDFGIQGLDDATLSELGVWPLGTNPIVSAHPIKCPAEVLDDMKDSCGANAYDDPTSSLAIDQCMYYCPGSTDSTTDYTYPWVPYWWGGCENNASCALPNSQCGGTVWVDGVQTNYTGPTCCQWGQTCEYQSSYYSGCT